jgi:hypothetical protein
MSTYFDSAYLAQGTPSEVETVRAAILELQEQYQGDHSMTQKPSIDAKGRLTWYCYSKGDMEDFTGQLAELTHRNGLRIWAYEGCTDGCCCGGLGVLENGVENILGRWEADIGLSAAVAAVQLGKAPDVDAALVMVHRIKIAAGDGWDDDDWAHLRAGGVSAVILANALSQSPSLLKSNPLADALQKIGAALTDIRHDAAEYGALKKGSIDKIDGLLALIESLEISKAAKPRKATKKSAPRI